MIVINTGLYDYVKENHTNICQIAVSKEGKTIYSEVWNGFNHCDCAHVASVTKSIVAILIGIAIDHNQIQNMEQRILDFFPEYQVKRGEKTIQQITIRNLLTMTTPYKYKSEPWTKVCTSEDWSKSILDLMGGRRGITEEFRYSTLGVQVLGEIILKTTGQSMREFANQYLFMPLGIQAREDLVIQNKDEHLEFITSKVPKEKVWFCNTSRQPTVGFGLCMSAEEMLKIGQLCLNQGISDKKQLVSLNWLEEMAKSQVTCGGKFAGMQYGLLWWVLEDTKRQYAAIGDSGNVIYVDHTNQVVVAITSVFKPAVTGRIEFIREHILEI